jgi:hypothetical protein
MLRADLLAIGERPDLGQQRVGAIDAYHDAPVPPVVGHR